MRNPTSKPWGKKTWLRKKPIILAIELVHELAEYLHRRYPPAFKVSRHPNLIPGYKWGWEGLPPIKSITVVPLQETHDLPLSLNDGERAAERAMTIAALMSVVFSFLNDGR